MKKKLLIPILSLVCLLACTICFACSGGGDNSKGGTDDGHRHSAQTYFVDDDSHWKMCDACKIKFDKGKHSMNANGICTVCGLTTVYTQGLELVQIIDDGFVIAYEVNGIGTATDVGIIIPSYYNGIPVTSIGYAAFRECNSLTSVTIPNSVTSIGSSAFYECDKLIQTENGVQYVDKWAIDCDTSVTSVNIRSNTVGIADFAFSYCSGLTSITIPDSVTSIGSHAFSYCSGLTSITLPDSVTSIGDWAFAYCSGLTSITLPDSVTSIGDWAFYKCRGLTSITLPDSVTSIGDCAFRECDKLIQTENGVQYVDKWVIDCDAAVTSVNVRSNTVGIGDHAFFNCSSLTSITIPNSVTSIGYCAFSGCSDLTNINFGGTKAQWNSIDKSILWYNGTENYTVTCTDGTISKS